MSVTLNVIKIYPIVKVLLLADIDNINRFFLKFFLKHDWMKMINKFDITFP